MNQDTENIGTRIDKTWLDDNQMTQSMDNSKRNEKHEPEVNLDPEPSSSDSLESLSSDESESSLEDGSDESSF